MIDHDDKRIQDYIQSAIADTVRLMHSTVDMTARNEVSAIRQSQQSHERICELDKEDAKEYRAGMTKKIDSVMTRLNAVIISTLVYFVVLLTGIVAFLIAPTFHP